MSKNRTISISKRNDGYGIEFSAMASFCELIIETTDKTLAELIGQQVTDEVWRIEDKYNRYDANSFCSKINQSQGQAIALDDETFALLNFADTCYQLSDGVFDITSGVLRHAWIFDGSDHLPSQTLVAQVMENVGWQKVSFDQHRIVLPANMEIDFGGIGKEYAVDRAIMVIKSLTKVAVLVNLGGDLATTSVRANGQPWQVGVEHPGFVDKQTMVVSLYQGALATSGDAKRYLLKNGKRYSHILNAITGWPVEHAPRSMTVSAPQCIQAGLLATLSQMQGENAEAFLSEQEIKFWVIR